MKNMWSILSLFYSLEGVPRNTQLYIKYDGFRQIDVVVYCSSSDQRFRRPNASVWYHHERQTSRRRYSRFIVRIPPFATLFCIIWVQRSCAASRISPENVEACKVHEHENALKEEEADTFSRLVRAARQVADGR